MGFFAKAAEIKRAANFGKTLTTGWIAGLCRCRTLGRNCTERLTSFYLAAGTSLPPWPRMKAVNTCNYVLK